MPEKDSNKRRNPNKKSQTFYLHKDVIAKLEELSRVSRYTKTDLINHWIEQEHAIQKEAGNLSIQTDPFPQPAKAGGASEKSRKVK
jgi:hypothetical protein